MTDNRLPLQHCKKHGRHYRTYCYQCKDEDVIGNDRKELFKAVAIAMLPFVKSTDDAEMFTKTVTVTAEAILKAAQSFAEKGES